MGRMWQHFPMFCSFILPVSSSPPPPPPLCCHWGETKEVTHSCEHSINLLATLLVLDSAPAPSVTLPVMLPSCCHLSAAGARLRRHGRRDAVPARCLFFFFRPAACQKNSKADGSVSPQCMAARGVFDRDHDTTWTRLIRMWGIYSIFYMQWERSAGKWVIHHKRWSGLTRCLPQRFRVNQTFHNSIVNKFTRV